ncbi:MAG: NAD(P)/FAD-dependent oxidoreductase [Myxococcota bacterium]
MQHFDVIVIGGGMAGLSTAWHLARHGTQRLCLLERDWACGTRASGLNAAIFRQLEFERSSVELAVRSRELMHELTAGRLVRETGALYLGPRERLEEARRHLAALDVPSELLEPEALRARFPRLVTTLPGVFIPGDGVIDIHSVTQTLQRALVSREVPVHVSTEVTALTPSAEGFTLQTNHGSMRATKVVLAGGAWNPVLGELVGAPLPLTPMRRHLALLETGARSRDPVVWRLDAGHEVYFRPESGGALASPCDETTWFPKDLGEVPTEAQALQQLAERLHDFEPSLAGASVRSFWACMRTFAPDREFVAGADPRVPGLFWSAALGGRGMTCGLALGEVVAAAVLGQAHPLHAAFSPARLIR